MFKKTLEKLLEIEKEFREEMNKVITSDEAEKIKKEMLGKGQKLDKMLKTLKDMVPDERVKIGLRLNDLKKEVEESYKKIVEKVREENK